MATCPLTTSSGYWLLTSFLLGEAVRVWNELRGPSSIPTKTVNEWLEADLESTEVSKSFGKGLEAAAGGVLLELQGRVVEASWK